MEEIIPFSPRIFFQYPSCEECWNEPCRDIQFYWPSSFEGRYSFTYRGYYSVLDCVFAEERLDKIELYLRSCKPMLVKDILEQLYVHFNFRERTHYDLEVYLDDPNDTYGRIDMLLDLCRDRIIVATGLPDDYKSNAQIMKWITGRWERNEKLYTTTQEEEQNISVTDSSVDPPKALELTNPRWEHCDEEKKKNSSSKVSEGDIIKLFVDVHGHAENGSVTFNVYDVNQEVPTEIYTKYGKNKQGVAVIEWTVNLKTPKGTTAKKIAFDANVKGIYCNKKEISLTEDEFADAMIFYLPGSDEYFVVGDKDTDSLINEVRFTAAFADKIATTHQQFSKQTDATELLKKTRELQQEALSDFEGLDKDPSNAIEEMIVVKKNKKWGTLRNSAYIRPYQRKNGKVKGHLRKNSDASIKKELKELLNPRPGKPGMDTAVSATLLSTKQIEAEWPDIWKFKGKQKVSAESESVKTKAGEFEGKAEAQWLRFVAGASIDTSFDWKNKTVNLSANGSISYIVAQGKISGTWYLADKDGTDLFQWLNLNQKGKDALKGMYECRLRLSITAEGHGFAGASASAAVALPNIDLSPKKKAIASEVSVSGFAGISGGGSLTPSLEWSRDKTDFNVLAEVSAGVDGSLGIGGEAKFSVSYTEGKFRIVSSAMLVLGAGGKGSAELSVGIDECFEMLSHIFYCVDYHRIDEVMQDAFDAFVKIAFSRFLPPELQKVLSIVGGATLFAEKVMEYIQKNITEAKRIIRTKIEDTENLKKAPPETLGGEVLRTLMKTEEPEDFDAIVKVLQSAKTPHELKWILRNVQDTIKVYTKMSETQKEEALKEGTKKVMEFGKTLDKELKKLYDYKLADIL